MNRGILSAGLVAIVALLLCASAGTAASGPGAMAAPVVVMPSAIQWVPVQGMAPLQRAVLYGDPTQAGSEYVLRYNVPDGFKFPVHWHPALEQVTVISGSFMVGVGDKWDLSKMTTLPAGAFVAIPPNVNHYGMAKGDTILEVHGIGPSTINIVK
jgi:quercetin dioxygenase-like cupin family protein